MEIKYNPKEWTPCSENCAYCCDPFYGHPKPHPIQRRLSDNKSPDEIEKESKLIKKTQN